MFLKVDPSSGTPIYLQIIEQIKWQVASGKLRIGDKIPTVRDLATDLKVNPNTVAKSYRDLYHQGILEGRPGQGSFIAGDDVGFSSQRCAEIVKRQMLPPVVQAFHLKMRRSDVLDVFQDALEEIYGTDKSSEEGVN